MNEIICKMIGISRISSTVRKQRSDDRSLVVGEISSFARSGFPAFLKWPCCFEALPHAIAKST